LIEGEAASSVESVAAREKLNRIPGFRERFQADRAINAPSIVQADMGIYSIDIDTDTTLITVNVIVRTTDPTDSAFLAVVLALVLIIQENTERTPIGAHSCLAGFTDLLGLLNSLARQAFNLFHGLSVHGMGFLRIFFLLVFDFIMTEPTGKELVTARRQEKRSAFVVGTRHLILNSYIV
jgi:hypothetical protein